MTLFLFSCSVSLFVTRRSRKRVTGLAVPQTFRGGVLCDAADVIAWCAELSPTVRVSDLSRFVRLGARMHDLIYLIGLVVVVMFILGALGLR